MQPYNVKETYALFPTCVMEFDLSNSIDHIDSLLDVINRSDSTQHGLIENGESSFFSGYHILELPEAKPIKAIIESCLQDYCETAGLDSVFLANSWWNKLSFNGNVAFHRHQCSVISGAFYPYVAPGSSALTFISPIIQCKMNDPYKNYTNYTAEEVIMEVKENHMYLFPSWLEHGVKTNHSSERIVVSFNADRGR